MRVLHVIPSLDETSGGPSRALMGLAPAQQRAGLQVSVLAGWQFAAPDSAADALRAAGVEVSCVGPCRGPFKSHPDLGRAVAASVAAADVVHIHGVWESIQHRAAVECRRQRRPYVFRPCGMLDPWCLAQGALRKRLYMAVRLRRNLMGAAALHATAPLEAAGFRRLGLTPPALVVPNGLDWDELDAVPVALERQAKLAVFLGRLHHKKGPDLLLRAFATLSDQGTGLVLAGSGDVAYIHGLKSMASTLGLSTRVEFPGHLSGMDRLVVLRRASVFVLPSSQENFGIAVAEALGVGTPVIVSDQVGIASEIAEGGVGDVVPLEVAPLAAALEQRLTAGEPSAELVARATHFARERYDWNAIAGRWCDEYERMVKR